MRTIVVGDMHQKQRAALPIVDNAVRLLGMPRLDQLVGHTPVYSVRELEEQGFWGERFIACDTFSTDFDFRPLGDGSVLLADDETHEMRAVTPEEVDCDWTGAL